MKKMALIATLALTFVVGVWAQEPEHVGTIRVVVVDRTTKAINYRHRSGATEVDLRGTALMPKAKGQATVNSKQGRIEIKARMEKLTPATQFGPEYLTYVLWAVTPEGRPKNLGEILLNGDNSKIDVTTDFQTFGLIVTAEPYFAVTQPSNMVVMENFVSDQTTGTIQPIETHYELVERGQYLLNAPETDRRPYPLDSKTPLELYEARNAVRIARWSGAGKYDPETLHDAEISLQNAEDELRGKIGKKTVAQNSRDAAEKAEDARLISIRRRQEEDLANERAAAAQREGEARAQASQAQSQASQAESEREAAERAKREAEEARMNAERAEAEANAAAGRAQQEKGEAEAARAQALAQQQAAEAEVARSRESATQAEQEKTQLREQLRQQLNTILETRETARGLIVNMSDVLFDFGKYMLKPGAKEKLAKISGIIVSHPGLNLQVEGHTDSVGSDEVNQRLSEQRAQTVQSYLAAQGVPPNSITAQGFGKTRPVATNDTAAGRQRNRRVELVVSGDVIGTQASQQLNQ